MTRARLLHELDSYELTQWLAFLRVKHEREEETAKRAKQDREYDD